MFKKLDKKKTFPEIEQEILKFWEENKTFQKSLDKTKDKKQFVFYDGPPFATGLPHYGHLLPGTIKDIIPRYWTMKGYHVKRRFGWDCHGLPVEKLVQDELNLKSTTDIVSTGIHKFNEQCRSSVFKYAEAWRTTVNRMGRWVDFDNDYKTMDLNYMESIWWVFKQIWDKQRVYKAYRVMPYSWALTTPLSNFEANSNYKDVQDPSITIRFKFKNSDEYFLAWTTTPWTLPSNLALCVGPDIDYVKIKLKESGAIYTLAKARLSSIYKNEEDYEIIEELKGKELYDTEYEPLFPYFEKQKKAFRVLNDPFVTTEDGTGVVHMAPAYGEEDYRICLEEGIQLVDPLDNEAIFTKLVPDFEGRHCKEADKDIIKKLKNEGKLIHQSTIVHSYPFCDRSDTPLIYRAIDAWYIKVEDLRDKLTENNKKIHWVPDYVGEKRFGNWLKDAKDWNISRNRFWGSCLPIWICPDCGEMKCIGSIQELEELSKAKVTDLHKHNIDPITFECSKDGCNGIMKRTPEVFDCWFESGAMPYSQNHYPFENKEEFDANFPADFIAEGLDQTRGWFYTLLVLSTILFDKPAIKNVVVNGLILAEDGKKMSKRLKNYPDPMYVLEQYGADTLRMYLINSPVVRAEDLKFSEDGLKEILKAVIIPFWNAYNFFIEYAITDNWNPETDIIKKSENELDRWILSKLQSLIKEVNIQMQAYNLFKVVPIIVEFIENLTNWYIRRSRSRFWSNAKENKNEKAECHSTLYMVLVSFSKVISPILPFLSEEIYKNLVKECRKDSEDSIHLCDYPEVDESFIDLDLENRMDIVRNIVGLGNAMRSKHSLKNRQPLSEVSIVLNKNDKKSVEAYSHLILDELNVKSINFVENEDELVNLSIKANFRLLGKKFGKTMKEAAAHISTLDSNTIKNIEEGGSVSILGVNVTLDDVFIERIAKSGGSAVLESRGGVTIGLNTEITDKLLFEGYAQEFKNRVNTMRKEGGFDKEDRIDIFFETKSKELNEIIMNTHNNLIKSETLSLNIHNNIPGDLDKKQTWKVYNEDIIIAINYIK